MSCGHIVVVGSNWVFRQGLKQTLRRLDLVLIGEGDDLGQALADGHGALSPNVVLILVGSSEYFSGAIDQVRDARAKFEGARLVMLGDAASDAEVMAVIHAGADALLSPKLSSRLLSDSLQLVLHGQKLFPEISSDGAVDGDGDGDGNEGILPSIQSPPQQVSLVSQAQSAALQSQVIRLEERTHMAGQQSTPMNLVWTNTRPNSGMPHRSSVPSEREWEILRCLARGNSNKAIARELGIAETTVKVHIKSLLRKLCVSNRTQAAIWALGQNNILDGDGSSKMAQKHLPGD